MSSVYHPGNWRKTAGFRIVKCNVHPLAPFEPYSVCVVLTLQSSAGPNFSLPVRFLRISSCILLYFLGSKQELPPKRSP